MAKQTLNIGLTPNDGQGDTLRDGGDKLNDNFNELYAALGGDTVKIAIPSTGLNANEVLKYNSGTGVFEPAADVNTDTTYSQSAETAGANTVLRLRQDAAGVITNDDIALVAGTGLSITRTDADTITFTNTVINTTYDISVQSLVAGSQTLRLTGSNATTDDVNFTAGNGIDISSNGPNAMTIAADVQTVNGLTGAVTTYPRFTATSEDASNFQVTGAGLDPGSEPDPDLYVYRGFTYEFANNTGGSAAVLIDQQNGNPYPPDFISSTGLNASEAADGEVITFSIPMSAATGQTYRYRDPVNANKSGAIIVV